MPLKYTLLPSAIKLVPPLRGESCGGRFGVAYWLLLFVCIFCIFPTVWLEGNVHGQEQTGVGLSQNSASSALPQSTPSDAGTEPTDAWLAQARAAVQAGSFLSAEDMVRKYLSQNDTSADGHYLLGYILSHEVKAKESLAEYTRAAQLRPPAANDLKVVAVDYVLLNDFADADRWLTKALEWNPSDADGWYYLGRTKYNENRFSEAIDAFQRCLKIDTHNVKAEDNLGLSYEGLNQTQQALQAFQAAIAWQTGGSRKDAQPYLNLGMLLAEQGDPNAGLGYLQEAVALAPQNAKAHEQLGRVYLKLKRLKDAQTELERAVQLAPNSSSLHFELGINYRDQGLKDQARKEFDRCAELNANHSSVDTPNE
jgi:tetratricopeptide (TPR) repeat protein